jgi:hypothetical protein
MLRIRIAPFLIAISFWGALASVGKTQSIDKAAYSSTNAASLYSSSTHPHLDLEYRRPTEKMKLRAYLFDAFGPYPILGAAFIAGVDQGGKTPREWGQGTEAYGQRFGSDLGIAAVTTTTRYALAKAFREDTVYYRCECRGVFRRMRHALISTVTARRGEDGERQLSLPAIVAPYAGTMTAVYAWYPGRYGAKDALRMGNYNLLAFAGENVALEFLYGGPHTLFSHLHRPAFPGGDIESAANH